MTIDVDTTKGKAAVANPARQQRLVYFASTFPPALFSHPESGMGGVCVPV